MKKPILNPRVPVLREVIRRLAPLLSTKGIKVVMRGLSASCAYGPDGKPHTITLPELPDDCPNDLLDAVQGFLDHECAHALFSGFDALKRAKKSGVAFIGNALEDTFIEREMGKLYPGSTLNLRNTQEFWLNKIMMPGFKKAQAADTGYFGVLFVIACRAWAGQQPCIDFMADKWHLISKWVDVLDPALIKRVPLLSNSDEVTDLAIEIKEALKNPVKTKVKSDPDAKPDDTPSDNIDNIENLELETPPPSPPSEAPPEETEGEQSSSSGESEQKPEPTDDGEPAGKDAPESSDSEREPESDDDEQESGNADAGPDADSDEPDAPTPGEPESDAEPAEGESDSQDEQNDTSPAGGQDENDDEPSGEGANADAQPDDSAADDEPAPAGGEDAAGEAGEGSTESEGENADDAPADGEPESADATPSDDPGEPGDDGTDEGESVDPSIGNPALTSEEINEAIAELAKEASFDADLSRALTSAAVDAARASDYVVFTRERDRIAPHRADFDPVAVTKMTKTVDTMAYAMQAQLEHLVAARSQSFWVGGKRNGRLNTSALHRLSVGRDDVFRNRVVNQSRETALLLLADLSGSMGGSKVRIAMYAAYAFSMLLERLRVKNEVLGFSTDGHDDERWMRMIVEEGKRHGVNFSRYEHLDMPIFKGFDEPLGPEQTNAMADAAEGNVGMCNNIDGESVDVALRRLAARKEARKVLIVLSDGQPQFNGDTFAGKAHLKAVIEQGTRAGIDILGIGIQSTAVAQYYPKHILIDDIKELPDRLMTKLHEVLL
ncbi:cobaltochelatase CobT-related protein [Cupriavidus metallidurans]|uniref:cobaltochelatase CobT-related protein n=1 Tax=Cupriavidus metallidurans TaxID=119219 RepID=UPI001CCD05F0|nr:hypothetical protein [Cupriavidus metallidurans]UBM12726.1 hypothetical protein LAI70_28345 [Cupriavidus metallidurans]